MLTQETIINYVNGQIPAIQASLIKFVNEQLDVQTRSQFTGSPDPTVKFVPNKETLTIHPETDAPITKLIKLAIKSGNNVHHNLSYIQNKSTISTVWHNLFSKKGFRRGLVGTLDPKMLDQSIEMLLPFLTKIQSIYQQAKEATAPMRAEFQDKDTISGNAHVDSLVYNIDATLDKAEDYQNTSGVDSLRNFFGCLSMIMDLSKQSMQLSQQLGPSTEVAAKELISLMHQSIVTLDEAEESIGAPQGQWSGHIEKLSSTLAMLIMKFRLNKDAEDINNPCSDYRNKQKSIREKALKQQLDDLNHRQGEIEALLNVDEEIAKCNRQIKEIKKLLGEDKDLKETITSFFSKSSDANHSEEKQNFSPQTRAMLLEDKRLITQRKKHLLSIKVNKDELNEELADIKYHQVQIKARLMRIAQANYQPLFDSRDLRQTPVDNRSEIVKAAELVGEIACSLATALYNLIVEMALYAWDCIHINGQPANTDPDEFVAKTEKSKTPESQSEVVDASLTANHVAAVKSVGSTPPIKVDDSCQDSALPCATTPALSVCG